MVVVLLSVGVEFVAVRRQAPKRDVVGDLQRLGHVPAGLIQHQHHVLVGAGLFADELQVLVHVVRVVGWGEHRLRIARDWVDGREQVHPLVFGLLDGRGA